jgi:hypothetical protein
MREIHNNQSQNQALPLKEHLIVGVTLLLKSFLPVNNQYDIPDAV